MKSIKLCLLEAFFACTDNINYKFNGEVIEDILTEKDVHYIDITQMVHTFALRKDLILAFEIILRQIQNKKTGYPIFD